MSNLKFLKRTNLLNKTTTLNEIDDIDKIPNNAQIKFFDILILILSIFFHFSDSGYDIYLIFYYFLTNQFAYFAWTIAFTTIPTIIITLISISMYIQDLKGGLLKNNKALLRIVLCILGLVVQLAPAIRLFDSLKYALKSKKAESQHDTKHQFEYYKKMLEEDSDVALLKVFECYLESAFQLVLQLVLLLIDYSNGSQINLVYQSIMITLSFMNMGLCMATYNKCIRYDREDKQNISFLGVLVQFFWHSNFTVSRIFTIAAGGILYPLWTVVAVVVHWSGMTVWLAGTQKTNFCGKNPILEILFCSAVAIIYIFNFISLQDGPTRKSYIAFYLVCAVENVFASLLWGIAASSIIKNWAYYIFLILPVATFAISICFLLIYYIILHPNKSAFKFNKSQKAFNSCATNNTIEKEISCTNDSVVQNFLEKSNGFDVSHLPYS